MTENHTPGKQKGNKFLSPPLSCQVPFFPAGFFSPLVRFFLKHEGAHDKVSVESESEKGMRAQASAEVRVWLQFDSHLHHHSNAIFVAILQDVGSQGKSLELFTYFLGKEFFFKKFGNMSISSYRSQRMKVTKIRRVKY